jgi:hypothetical protein
VREFKGVQKEILDDDNNIKGPYSNISPRKIVIYAPWVAIRPP